MNSNVEWKKVFILFYLFIYLLRKKENLLLRVATHRHTQAAFPDPSQPNKISTKLTSKIAPPVRHSVRNMA